MEYKINDKVIITTSASPFGYMKELENIVGVIVEKSNGWDGTNHYIVDFKVIVKNEMTKTHACNGKLKLPTGRICRECELTLVYEH